MRLKWWTPDHHVQYVLLSVAVAGLSACMYRYPEITAEIESQWSVLWCIPSTFALSNEKINEYPRHVFPFLFFLLLFLFISFKSTTKKFKMKHKSKNRLLLHVIPRRYIYANNRIHSILSLRHSDSMHRRSSMDKEPVNFCYCLFCNEKTFHRHVVCIVAV